MRTRLSILIIILFTTGILHAQNGSIKGKITGSGNAIAAATVSLLYAADSSWIKSELTDDNGVFTLNSIALGKFIVSVSSVGYKTINRAVEIDDSRVLHVDFELQKVSTSLNEVAVTAKKPFIEMRLGKTIVNVEGSAGVVGANLLDLMRRLPGVTVDQKGNISMQGKDGVLVLIDDRPSYMTGDDLAEYLKTISAEDAAQVELITQPGSRFEAEGNAGIINFKIKRNRRQGWNGDVSAKYGQGVYALRSENFRLNYKKNKLNFSISGSDMEAKGFAEWDEKLYYINEQSGAITAKTSFYSHPVEHFANTALRIATDYELSSKTTLGISIRGSYHPNRMPFQTNTANYDVVNNTQAFKEDTISDHSLKKDLAVNYFLTHKFDKDNSLNINLDYLNFDKMSNEDYASTLYDGQRTVIGNPIIFSSRQPLNINVYSLKADFEGALGRGWKLEAGVKASLVSTDYNALFQKLVNNQWIVDTGRSNHFTYNENVNAGYISVSGKLGKKWEAKAGLRIEQTNSEGVQYVNKLTNRNSYFAPFPTIYIGYKLDSFNQFELNYGRRIDRPSYNDLNPFAYYSFQNTYRVGNPGLLPQYSNTAELKHRYKGMIITTISCSRITDVVSDILEVRGADKTVYNVQKNLASNSYISGAVNFNKDIFKWCSFNSSVSVFASEYTGVINNKNKTVRCSGYSINAGGQFDFGNGWKSEFYVNYYSAGRRDINESFDGHVYMEFGCSKKLSDHLMLRLSASDPFELDQLKIHNDAGNFREDISYRYGSKHFSIALTYSFGGKQKEQRSDKQIEEAQRL